jgi:hypothetical protein
LRKVGEEEDMRSLLETHEPVLKNTIVGLAKISKSDEILDLVCLGHGISSMTFNNQTATILY